MWASAVMRGRDGGRGYGNVYFISIVLSLYVVVGRDTFAGLCILCPVFAEQEIDIHPSIYYQRCRVLRPSATTQVALGSWSSFFGGGGGGDGVAGRKRRTPEYGLCCELQLSFARSAPRLLYLDLE